MTLLVMTGVLLTSAIALLDQYIKHQHPDLWYPFAGGFFGDMYVASPFGFTSNIREDNPIWEHIPAINTTLSRMTYAMTRGHPEADIAWLMLSHEYPDKAELSAGTAPNAGESFTSITMNEAGLVYERISRHDLLQATAADQNLQVGAMHYRALLVDQASVMAPELLQRIQHIADAGIPVIWIGELPQRAYGWANHLSRDEQVALIAETLRQRIIAVTEHQPLGAILATHVPSTVLAAGSHPGLKLQRRRSDDTQWLLFFNDSPQPLDIRLAATLPEPLRWLDPESGSVSNAVDANLPIPPGQSRLLQVGDSASDWDPAEWQQPGMQYRPYIRWWWPGNAVNSEALLRELNTLHSAGFGGVEIQTLTFGLRQAALREQQHTIYQVGSDAWFAHVRMVLEHAAKLGMKVDLTLGSGWPTGGPFITEYPEQQLLMASAGLEHDKTLHALPSPSEPLYARIGNMLVYGTQGSFDTNTLLTAVTAARRDANGKLADFTDLTVHTTGHTVQWQAPEGDWQLFAFYRNATHHNVLASAYPGSGPQDGLPTANVIDHLDRDGIGEYIDKLGKPWLEKLAPYKPDAFFVDSFELIGQLPWSARFQAAFHAQHGYDIAPYLPLVFRQHGESKYLNMLVTPEPAYIATDARGQRIREDYEATREQLFRDEHVQPLKDWLEQQRIPFRLQAHGGFGDYLDTYRIADIPESEGLFANGNFEFLKLAASAGHIAGNPMISSESFVAMTPDPNRFNQNDFLYLAGNAYAAGINRLMFHGYAHAMPIE
ncbi:MAG: hypothetical protein EP312_04215 [Gammaproteobacteria bacterium]|nr:MAG: hypothetical protein EP312_04215 [Gammaproteobacteria bacterium]